MRTLFDFTPTLGVTSIEEICVDAQSRDDVPRIALASQSIWRKPLLRDRIVTYLREVIAHDTDQRMVLPGMNYWRLFVLAQVWTGLRL